MFSIPPLVNIHVYQSNFRFLSKCQGEARCETIETGAVREEADCGADDEADCKVEANCGGSTVPEHWVSQCECDDLCRQKCQTDGMCKSIASGSSFK